VKTRHGSFAARSAFAKAMADKSKSAP
jgi:hypothetical protein